MIQCKKKKEGLRANAKLHLTLKMTPTKQVAKNPADLNHMPFQADGSHPILQNLNSSSVFPLGLLLFRNIRKMQRGGQDDSPTKSSNMKGGRASIYIHCLCN